MVKFNLSGKNYLVFGFGAIAVLVLVAMLSLSFSAKNFSQASEKEIRVMLEQNNETKEVISFSREEMFFSKQPVIVNFSPIIEENGKTKLVKCNISCSVEGK